MSAAAIATQPAAGVSPGRARWKKIALPRPLQAGEIAVEHEDEIVERVLAPHPVRAIGGGQADGPVVARAGGVLAPSRTTPQRPQRRAAGRGARSVGTEIGPQQPKSPRRRRASPSRLSRANPLRPSAQEARNGPAISQPSARSPGRGRTRRVLSRPRRGRGARARFSAASDPRIDLSIAPDPPPHPSRLARPFNLADARQ